LLIDKKPLFEIKISLLLIFSLLGRVNFRVGNEEELVRVVIEIKNDVETLFVILKLKNVLKGGKAKPIDIFVNFIFNF
jgi:hypothetical protein